MKIRFSTLLLGATAIGFLLAPTLWLRDILPTWNSSQHGPDSWSEPERRILASIQLQKLPEPPPDPSNKYQLDPAAVQLGKRLFFDPRLSANGAVSCASCHDPKQQYQDGRTLGQAIGMAKRRTMALGDWAYDPFQTWDGRKDSQWAQALSPLEDPSAHGLTRVGMLHLISAHYKVDYEKIFGPLPKTEGLPPQAGPLGNTDEQEAWQSLPKQTRFEISRSFANIGKAIAAWERTLRHEPGRVDRYIEALLMNQQENLRVLNAAEKNGLRIFIGKAQCITCHNGPLLSDYSFHNTGVPVATVQEVAAGRGNALSALLQDPFNCLGPFSDAKPEQCGELRFLANDNPAWLGAFKTPGLRGVAQRPPYMHAGQFATLGHNEHDPMTLTPSEITDLLAFLHALDSKIVERAPNLRITR